MINLKLLYSGKVRDLYEIDDKRMLMVASDRLSAFDVILPNPIPNKGIILTQISNFWFTKLQHIIPNHLLNDNLTQLISADQLTKINKRAVIVKKLKPLPIEAIVRGYLAGSGWQEYQQSGSICGIKLPTNMQQAEQLPAPIFTPSTKADKLEHDENISFAGCANLIGTQLTEKIRDTSILLYQTAANYAKERGVILADTKFEFGLDENDNLIWMDEALTPDSSRFWDANNYQVGISPVSFDKQFIRDYLLACNWNKNPPAPNIPDNIIAATAAKYAEALTKLTSYG